MHTGADGSSRPTSIATVPYCPSVTPHTPTSAWAIGDSAGDRRGRLGIVGTSYDASTNSAAWRALRWGRLPTPTVAPDVSHAAR